MKKILAGVLASASLLAMTTSAFAADKKVTAPGEVEYEVSATAPKIVLNLIMPAKMSASLNPYGADLKMTADLLDDEGNVDTAGITTNAAIMSPAYEIKNMSTDYGIVIDATAVTTVATADKTPWTVVPADPTAGKKGAQMALITAATADDLKTVAEGTLAETPASILMLNSTVAANKDKGIAAGQTNQKKFVNIASADPDDKDADGNLNGTSAFIGFAGKLADSSATVDVEWTEDDSINVALVLKVVAGPKGAASSSSAASGPKFANASDVTLGASGGANAVAFTFNPNTTTYNLTSDLDNTGGRLDLTVGTVTDATVSVTADGTVLAYSAANGRITANSTGSGWVKITLTDDNDNSKVTTYTLNFTVS